MSDFHRSLDRALEFTASIETIELLCGASLIPLCERKIPAEGTE